MQTYEKASGSQLHDGKTKIIKLGKARTKNENSESLNVNFTTTHYNENETYLGDVIGNNVAEIQTFQKTIAKNRQTGR